MKMYRISNIGLKGLNTDLAPWELGGEYITNGANFRVSGNALESAGNYLAWSAPGTNFNAGNLIHVADVATGFWLVAGRSAVYAFNGTWYDISNTAGYAGLTTNDELLWTMCKLGRIPIINNPQSYPEYWSPQSSSQVMQDLNFDATNTWRAKGYQCKVMRSHKNYLFALNLVEGAVEFHDSYRWSHPADINGLPYTWDENDTAALAGKAQIGGDSGDLIDGKSLRNSFCLYAQQGIHILDPSNDEFVWRRRQLSSSVGLITSNCAEQVKNTHFLLVDGDIVTNDGNSIISIVKNRIRKRLNSNINSTYFDRSYVVNNFAKKELMFCVPEGSATTPSTAYIYNWKDDKWSIQDIYSGIVRSSYGPRTISSQLWSNQTANWNTTSTKWTAQSITPLNNKVIGIDYSNSGLVELEPDSGTGTANTNTLLERTNLVIGEENAHLSKTVLRIYPHLGGSSPVQIQIGSQDVPNGVVTWGTLQTFTPGTDRKLDVRSTGKLHAWRIYSVNKGSIDLSGLDFEYAEGGER